MTGEILHRPRLDVRLAHIFTFGFVRVCRYFFAHLDKKQGRPTLFEKYSLHQPPFLQPGLWRPMSYPVSRTQPHNNHIMHTRVTYRCRGLQTLWGAISECLTQRPHRIPEAGYRGALVRSHPPRASDPQEPHARADVSTVDGRRPRSGSKRHALVKCKPKRPLRIWLRYHDLQAADCIGREEGGMLVTCMSAVGELCCARDISCAMGGGSVDHNTATRIQ